MTTLISSRPIETDHPNVAPSAGRDAVLDALDRLDFRAVRTALDRFVALGVTVSGYPVARPSDCSAITERLEEIFRTHQRWFERRDAETVERFLSLINEYEISPALRVYGGEALRVLFLKVRTLIIVGRAREALDLVEPWAERPYRIQDSFDQIQEAFQLDLMARLSLGRIDEVSRVAVSRVRFLGALAVPRVPWIFNTFFRALSIAPSKGDPEYLMKSLLAIPAAICMRRERVGSADRIVRALWYAAKLAALAAGSAILTLDATLNPCRRPLQLTSGAPASDDRKRGASGSATSAILVTRPMGGLGDIVMMTPGLRALRQKFGGRIAFAIPTRFHLALENNPDVELLDSDAFIDLGQYRTWINLGLCPAGRYESRATPNVRKGRVELFAHGMGISAARLASSGVKPVAALTQAQTKTRDTLTELARAAGRKLVGVAMFSRDSYKDYPHVKALIAALAERHMVVAMHERAADLPASPFVIGWFNRSIEDAIAAVAACDALVSVDTSLYHISSAFDVPAVGLFGSASGEVRSEHFARAIIVEADSLACRPCWRNEDEKCSLTGTLDSACMRAIDAHRVIAAVEALLHSPQSTKSYV